MNNIAPKAPITPQIFQMLEAVFQSATDGILIVRNQNEIIQTNPAVENFFGYAQDELLRLPLETLIPSGLSHNFWDNRKTGKKPFQGEEIIKNQKVMGVHKDGSEGPLQVNIHLTEIQGEPVEIFFMQPVSSPDQFEKHENGQPALPLARNAPKLKGQKDTSPQNYTEELEQKVKKRTRELTAMVKKLVETNLSLEYQMHETKLADAQAKKNYALYVAIARYFPKVMIVVIDRDYRIVFLDGEELQKIGLDKENVEGLAIRKVKNFSAEWKNQMIAYAEKTFQGGHFYYEIKYRTNNYKVNTMPLDDGQLDVNLVMFVFTNITEQKKTEVKMLKALKKERELSELKSRFVSMASHEFRTPLSTILSSANLIARQNEPGKEEKRLKNVARIKSSVKNLVDILNEFLSIGRLEEGEVHMKKEVFELNDFMKTIIQELQHVQKPGQQVRLTSDKKIIQVNLDKQFTRNVFLNLLSNALKYSPHNKPVDLIITTEGSAIMVKVRDQGIGIPEDEQKNLFNLFFRARNVTNIEGTGLGLPIVKKYIELMNGKITFESLLEQGTTFTIFLPMK